MDVEQDETYTFTVRPFGYEDGQHFTLILNNKSNDYYLFYYVFLDKYGSMTEGTSLDFLESILDFLHVKYDVKDWDENIYNVINYITSKSKEECTEWINYTIENVFYDFTQDNLDEDIQEDTKEEEKEDNK